MASNQFGYLCPRCKCGDKIDVVALVWVRLTPDGTDTDLVEDYDHDHDWNDASSAKCSANCGWSGKVRELLSEGSN